jgi:hypothetical protein
MNARLRGFRYSIAANAAHSPCEGFGVNVRPLTVWIGLKLRKYFSHFSTHP